MKKDFRLTFSLGYDQADTAIQLMQLESRLEKLKQAVDDKSAGRAYDMLLLRPAFFPPIKKSNPGLDIAQVDKYISSLKEEIHALELRLLG